MTQFVVTVLNPQAVFGFNWAAPVTGDRERDRARRAMTVLVANRTRDWNPGVNGDGADMEAPGPWYFETERDATDFGMVLASRRIGSDVTVSKAITIFQSEQPKIITKSVSEKGILPK